MSFLVELKRRNVLRVAAAYIVAAWLIIQVTETILPQYNLEHHVRTVITFLAIGFIPALILAWALEWTPEGIKLDAGADDQVDGAPARSSRKFDRVVIVILTLALAWFVYDKLVPPAPDAHYSIAVLPFTNESPGAMPDYLAEGLAGEVLDLLAKLPELLVIGRSSAFSAETRNVAVTDVGSRLNVSHVLTGAVTQLGAGIRVRARLVDAGSGEALWSRVYSGGLNDVFAIQDEIAGDVVQGLEIETHSPLPESRRTTPEVQALTLQAKQLFHNELGQGIGSEMTALLEEALEIDPYYTPAMVWMVYANYELRGEGLISGEEEYERWLKLAGRILAIEPENASAHNFFGWQALYVDRDVQAAASSYARALRSEPNDAEILRTASRFPMLIGRMDDGVAMIDRSMAIDPLCSLCLYHASRYYMYAGRFEKAEALRQRFVTLHETQGQFQFGIMKLLRGKAVEALELFEAQQARTAESNPMSNAGWHAGRAMALHTLGRSEESDEQLALLIEGFGEQDPNGVAQVYAWRNEKDTAFDWLERFLATNRPNTTMVLLNPVYRDLHDDPRWTAVREKLGFSDEQLATLEFPVDLLLQYSDE